jgi:hypothetical protein
MSGDRSNRSGWWNYLKDTVLRSHRAEYEDQLFILNNTVLHPDNVAALVDEVTAQASTQEASQSASGLACGFTFESRATSFKNFARVRHDYVNSELAQVALEAGSSQTVFVGDEVLFDASESSPDESPENPYTWSNGMVGETPTYVFDDPGTYEIVLTVLVRGVPFEDSLAVTVLPRPETAFFEQAGQLILEAESYYAIDDHGETEARWEPDTVATGFSGTAYVEGKSDVRRNFVLNYSTVAPELLYVAKIETPGTYRVWIRAMAPSRSNDSCFVGLDGKERSTREYHDFEDDPDNFLWSGNLRGGDPDLLEVEEPGLHLFSVWMKENGLLVDKILLTQDLEFTPEGLGPNESPLRPLAGGQPFIRGDTDQDSRLTITDAIITLTFLFRGGELECPDHGDLNDDGLLDITDPIALLRFLFQRGDPPAAPYPDPGLDPTADDPYACGDAGQVRRDPWVRRRALGPA